MAVPLGEPTVEAVSLWVLAGAGAYTAFVLARSGHRGVTDRLRRRFLLGVPWGTVVVVTAVLGVYYLVQGGGKPGGPVVVAFRSWSYSYPLGMVLAPFSHASTSHVAGNLLSTVAFAPVAEYAWSHYPTARGSHSFGTLRENPFARMGLFVLGVLLVGIATSLFIPGALIGFSGVVFAFGGLALVTRPVAAVFALVGERVVRLVYFAVQDPVLVVRGRQQFVTPWWADIAVQGHALGLLVGVLLGLALLRSRRESPDPRRVWFAALAFTVWNSLYALYWYLSSVEFVLFRGAGTAALLVLAGLVAAALARTDRPLVDRIGLSRREAATGLLVCVFLAIALAAVPYNAVSVSPGPESDTGVQVQDYTVTYAESVPNRYVGAVEVPFVSESLAVETSGVIVASERRDAWEAVVPAGRLAVRGEVSVPLGGLGWRETVVVNRTSWSLAGGSSTYKVFVEHAGDRTRVFAADPVNVSAVVDRRRIRIGPADPGYQVAVSYNGSVDTAPLPAVGRNVTVAGVTFNRTGNSLRAVRGGTRLPVATWQSGSRDRRQS